MNVFCIWLDKLQDKLTFDKLQAELIISLFSKSFHPLFWTGLNAEHLMDTDVDGIS